MTSITPKNLITQIPLHLTPTTTQPMYPGMPKSFQGFQGFQRFPNIIQQTIGQQVSDIQKGLCGTPDNPIQWQPQKPNNPVQWIPQGPNSPVQWPMPKFQA